MKIYEQVNNKKTNNINQFSGSAFSLTSTTRWASGKASFLVEGAGCPGVIMRKWVHKIVTRFGVIEQIEHFLVWTTD